ncbi:coiled-coil domain-containing protein 97 [Larus michahellis]|uniref:coiled-coil domain-containing protein 97 n=1 Tax=Larus michahellis TaxID=119627 RepID=UPI003D9BA58D
MAGWDPKTEGTPMSPSRSRTPQRPKEGAPRSPAGCPPPAIEGDPKTSPPRAVADAWAPPGAKRDPPKMWGRPRRSPARTRLRNRRYAALRQLIRAGEYFSEEEMRAREPLLYQHYIGQYLEAAAGGGAETTSPGVPAPPPRVFFAGGAPPPQPRSLTGLLLRSLEEAAVRRRLRRQRLRDGDSTDEEGDAVPDAGERAVLREEFTTRMYQRFLDGEDGDFDYSQVDENPDLDNLDIVSRDAEERYFDAEEPSAAPQLD